MKKTLYLLAALTALYSLSSCNKDSLDKENSVITIDKVTQTPLDKWLEVNYVNPYNIDFKYRYEQVESDLDYYTVPANYECSIMMAHLVKYLCIDTYDEVAGINFTRSYFPKEFFLIGVWEYRNNGTYILGTAEGGKKVLLSGVNFLPQVIAGTYMPEYTPASGLNHFYIKTIHHEFTHILNQNFSYSADFEEVTGDRYILDEWSDYSTAQALARGFITPYSQHSAREDFAEMLSMYVTNDQATWDGWMAQAGSAADDIQTKLDIVRTYMRTSFDIDIDELRSVIARRQDDVVSGKIDLTTVE